MIDLNLFTKLISVFIGTGRKTASLKKRILGLLDILRTCLISKTSELMLRISR
jgi:hypothetical protein